MAFAVLTKDGLDHTIKKIQALIPTKTSQLTNDSNYLNKLPAATTDALGGVKVGSGLTVAADGTLTANGVSVDLSPYLQKDDAEATYAKKTDKPAAASTADKVANVLTFAGAEQKTYDGSEDVTVTIPEAYTLPTATADALGGIKVGSGLTITDGVLSANGVSVDLTPYLQKTEAETIYVKKTDVTDIPVFTEDEINDCFAAAQATLEDADAKSY